jgi:hypothetical protein
VLGETLYPRCFVGHHALIRPANVCPFSSYEVVLVPGYATPELVDSMPWDRVPPGLVFVPVPEGNEFCVLSSRDT